MFSEIHSLEQFNRFIEKEQIVLAYFSTETCNVCKVLKPKVAALFQNDFPQIKLIYIQSDKLPKVAADNRVFTAPAILVFIEGREYIRKSRNISLQELQKEIKRPYSMLF